MLSETPALCALQALQYVLPIAPPVDVVQFAKSAVQSHRKLGQRLNINFRPLGPHAVECLAPVLLPGAIEMAEERVSVRQRFLDVHLAPQLGGALAIMLRHKYPKR